MQEGLLRIEKLFGRGVFVLYQGTTSLGLKRIERELGFSPCVLFALKQFGTSNDQKSVPQGLKPDLCGAIYGPTKNVPGYKTLEP